MFGRAKPSEKTGHQSESGTNADAMQATRTVCEVVLVAPPLIVRASRFHHQIAVIKRIAKGRSSFIKRHSFGAPSFVKQRRHLVEVVRAHMINQIYSAKIGACVSRRRANFLFIASTVICANRCRAILLAAATVLGSSPSGKTMCWDWLRRADEFGRVSTSGFWPFSIAESN